MAEIASKWEQDERRRTGVEMLILRLSELFSHLSHSFYWKRQFWLTLQLHSLNDQTLPRSNSSFKAIIDTFSCLYQI